MATYKPCVLPDGTKLQHLNIYPSRRGATGICKSVRHWCFCVITEKGNRHTDQGHASKKAALAYIQRYAKDWS